MDRLDDEKKAKLLEYKKRALEHENSNKILSEKEILMLLVKALPVTNSLVLVEELKASLRCSPLYMAIAMWCDPNNGMGRLFPDQIIQVAEYFLPLEK